MFDLDQACRFVTGDIFAISLCARYIERMYQRRGAMLRYEQIPVKLRRRVDRATFADLASRIDEMHGAAPALDYVNEIVADTALEERQRRVAIYEAQWASVEQRYGGLVDSRPVSTRRRPVMSDRGEFFRSAEAAAAAMRVNGYPTAQRSLIRRAVKLGYLYCGRKWSFSDEDGADAIVPRARAIYDVANPKIVYRSLNVAAKAMAIHPQRLARQIEAGDTTLRFGTPAPAPQKREQLSLFAA